MVYPPPTSTSTSQEFLVEFIVTIPAGTPEAEVNQRTADESVAAAQLVSQGHLKRLWLPPAAPGEARFLGLYADSSQARLDARMRALPLYDWMDVTITPLAPHPNDPR